MDTVFKEFTTNAILKIGGTSGLESYNTSQQINFYTFIWAKENPIDIVVDSKPITLEKDQIIALTPIQYFRFIKGEDAIVYQFNREFYCIKDHDKEVSCMGLLFFGNNATPIINLDAVNQEKFAMLHELFLEELETNDTIQAEMLRMLMARFIIKTTRLLKSGSKNEALVSSNIDLFREFNLLLEDHFKESHSVSFYAQKLYKSPKTLSNSFSKYNKSPLKIIHDRIVLEAKRQLSYTDKTTKEIAFEVGFQDASHLSRLFKKVTGMSPTAFKEQLLVS